VSSTQRDAEAEIRAFEKRLARRGAAIQVAQLSLNERVREFVRDFGHNGGKTGRGDYTRIIPLDRLETLRIAVAELDRVRKPTPTPEEP
jgi:hypothetical protein